MGVCENSAALNEAMSMAVLDWDVHNCMGYVKSFVDKEVDARAHDLTAAGALLLEGGLETALMGHYESVDAITERFGTSQFVEGNIWRYQRDDDDALRALLESKRKCLLTSLAAAVPPPRKDGLGLGGRVAEIGIKKETHSS